MFEFVRLKKHYHPKLVSGSQCYICKRGAMFGLESRALKKQFGELFLARMQSVDSAETRGASGYAKRGAMFGLDARIALAIFGALSVISGAALYSAIKEARIVSAVAQLNELSKALISFNLDTGQDLPVHVAGVRKAQELVAPTVSSSKGPYLSYEDSGNGFTFDFRFLSTDEMAHIYDCADSFGDETLNTGCASCSAGNVCSPWLKLGNFTQDKLDALDEKIDGSDGFDKGSFRVQWADAGKTNARLFYKLAERNLVQP